MPDTLRLDQRFKIVCMIKNLRLHPRLKLYTGIWLKKNIKLQLINYVYQVCQETKQKQNKKQNKTTLTSNVHFQKGHEYTFTMVKEWDLLIEVF